jgi:hypothetical protein
LIGACMRREDREFEMGRLGIALANLGRLPGRAE